MSFFVITRKIDQRAIMQGSHACMARWGVDPQRVKQYLTADLAGQSMDLLCDDEDQAFICTLEDWIALAIT